MLIHQLFPEPLYFSKLERALTKEELNNFEKMELHFALGKAYDDIKDYKNSFSNIDFANSLKKEITNLFKN